MKKGFTLIELLVVVLIIGILAAIAVPQYTKAVEKARAAELVQIAGNLTRSIDVMLMENGGYPSGAYIGIPDMGLFMDFSGGTEWNSTLWGYVIDDMFIGAGCTPSDCQGTVQRLAVPGDPNSRIYDLWFGKWGAGEWEKKCSASCDNDVSKSVCEGLRSQGYSYEPPCCNKEGC